MPLVTSLAMESQAVWWEVGRSGDGVSYIQILVVSGHPPMYDRTVQSVWVCQTVIVADAIK